MKHSDYILINYIFAGIIGLIFVYSGIFSAQECNYPIHSLCITQDCPSAGLSRAFSEIVRLRLSSALAYNSYSLFVFSFFLIQFIQRFFVVFLLKRKFNLERILLIDLSFSITLFISTFWNVIF